MTALSVLRVMSAVLATAALGMPTAEAQYRDGQPAVLAPPPQTNPDVELQAARLAFSSWNEAAGRPSMLVFWNRDYTDETQTRANLRLHDVQTGSDDRTTSQERSYGRSGDFSRSDSSRDYRHEREVYASSQTETGGLYAPLEKGRSRRLEAAFVDELIASGAQLIDRDGLVRRKSLDLERWERGDMQYLETVALQENAAYLIEVLPNDADTPTGLDFSIKISHVPTSRIVAQLLSAGDAPPDRARYVATPNGFALQSTDWTGGDRDIARRLALRAMSALSASPSR